MNTPITRGRRRKGLLNTLAPICAPIPALLLALLFLPSIVQTIVGQTIHGQTSGNQISSFAQPVHFTMAGPASPRQAAGDPGKDTYDTKCSGCHENGANGPDLHGLFQRDKFQDGRAVNDDNVRDKIMKGSDIMPAFADQLSKDDIDALIRYLHTLK